MHFAQTKFVFQNERESLSPPGMKTRKTHINKARHDNALSKIEHDILDLKHHIICYQVIRNLSHYTQGFLS
jgi:hypothetical protein